jgi:hypothetical protein
MKPQPFSIFCEIFPLGPLLATVPARALQQLA